MRALFVHGMGRSSLSGVPLLWQLRSLGVVTKRFDYFVSCQTLGQIEAALGRALMEVARQGPYVLIGHSLGGVLIRRVLAQWSDRLQPPQRIFLLGSPVLAARLAVVLRQRRLFRWVTGECGQLLGSGAAMSEIQSVAVPTTAIVGTRTLALTSGFFGSEINDGVVALSEVCADWMDEVIKVPVVHTWLPLSRLVGKLVADRVKIAANAAH